MTACLSGHVQGNMRIKFGMEILIFWFAGFGLISAQYKYDPPPPPSPSNRQPEFSNLKPAPDGTEEEVWQYMRERGDTMFIATLAQGFSQSLPAISPTRTRFEDCVKGAYNSRTYAQCVLPLIRKRLRQMKMEQEKKHEKEAKQNFGNIMRDQPINEGNQHDKTAEGMKIVHKSGKWSDMELPPVDIPTQTPMHQVHQSDPHLHDPHMDKMSTNVAAFLTEFVRHLKNMTGPWGKMPDLDLAMKAAKDPTPRLSKNGPQLVGLKTETGRGDDSIFHSLLTNVMTAPLFLMKDSIQMAKVRKAKRVELKADQPVHTRKKREGDAQQIDKTNVLSPTLLNFFDNGNSNKPSFLSPDFLSLFDSPNSLASIPQLLSLLPNDQQLAWMKFFLEVTGAADYMRMVESEKFQDLLDVVSLSWYGNQTVPYKKVFDAKYIAVGEIFAGLNKDQWNEVNARGFSYLDEPQMRKIYGEQLDDPDFMPFNVKEYSTMNKIQKEELLFNMVDGIANNYYQTENDSFITDSPDQPRPRKKRQGFASPCFNAPYSGGTTLIVYLQAPQIVCPSIFSYIVLGPLILSPYVLSPYVMGPFILSPEVLTPFILSPYILSPDVLNPIVLSPGILNPTVLSPPILSPYVLSPQVLSPTVFSPLILSPLVLTPSVLSPSVGSPNILTPFVLNPSILSPAVLFVNVLSPGALSPSVLSPSDGPNILSPCLMCRKKRQVSSPNETRIFDQVEFSKRLYWTGDVKESEDTQGYFAEKYVRRFPHMRQQIEMLRKLLDVPSYMGSQ